MKIYNLYNQIISDVPETEGQAILEFSRKVRQNVGMGDPGPAPEGVTVRYSHTYGCGSAQIFYLGDQIASA